MIVITLTRAETKWADWALGPMRDIPLAEDPEERRYATEAVPALSAATLTFSTDNRAVVLDLLYRLEEQLSDMFSQAGKRYPRSARTLAAKIRSAFAVTEDESRLIARGEV